MTFEDLPADWPSRSLGDPTIAAGVADLVLRPADRDARAVSLIFCDSDGRMIQPVTVTDIPRDCPSAQRRRLYDAFVDHLGRSVGGLVVALGRPVGRLPDDLDRAWHEDAIAVCRRAGIDLLGTYLVSADGVHALPQWGAQAA